MKTTIKKMRLAAVMIASVALIAAFTACGGGSKSNSDSTKNETESGNLFDAKYAETANLDNVNLEGSEWVCSVKNEKLYRELHILFDSKTKFFFIEYKAGDPEGYLYGEGTYKVEDSSAESKTILFYNSSGLLISSMQLRNNTIVDESGDIIRVYVNLEDQE